MGGQLIPPVMGAAAFIMAETLGMSYWSIAVAAAIPGVLYFVAVGVMVHFEATRLALPVLDRAPRCPACRRSCGATSSCSPGPPSSCGSSPAATPPSVAGFWALRGGGGHELDPAAAAGSARPRC